MLLLMGDRHPVGERNVAALAVVYHCDPDKNSRLRRSASATNVCDGDLDLLRDEEALRYRFVVAVGAAAHRDGENTARKECAVGGGGALVGLVGVVGVMSMAPATVGGQAYPYDANGNVTGGGGRTYVWDTNNQPTSITGPDSVTETYGYDADGGRVSRARAGVTSVYLAGVWEQDIQSGASTKTRAFMVLQGCAIAQRERIASPASDTTIYLHGDHLGSVSVATDNDRRVLSRQDYTPWGEVRAGGVAQTTLDFTGQRRDGTGLLYYGARYYDPQLGRFLSSDSIVPGRASGKGGMAATLGQDGGAALRPLTVDFHEPGFAATLAREDAFTQAKGFRFQLSGQDRQQAKVDTGPSNPQALDRYSYVLNNPLRYTDPGGHCPVCLLPEVLVALAPYLAVAVLVSCAVNPYCRAAVGDFYEQWKAGAIEFRQYVASGVAAIQQLLSSARSGGTSWWIEPKKQEQADERGWTIGGIQDVLDNPVDTAPALDKTSGNSDGEPATNYYAKDGYYVVRNNRTGKIVQVSNRNDPDWKDQTTDQPVYPR